METRRALDLSVQEVIYAGLEALVAVVPLELCAYLNRSDSSGHQLFLGSPSLSGADGQHAYEIFSGLRDALDRPRHRQGLQASGRAEEFLDIAGVPALLVVTAGAVSQGVHAIGRPRPFDQRERAALVRLACALGTAGHRLQSATDAGALRA